jgi:hypothetical protein
MRRRARTSGEAVTNSFTSASGHTMVPMSRPSSTAPGGAAIALQPQHPLPDRRKGRNDRGRFAQARPPDLVVGDRRAIELAGRLDRGGLVVGRLAALSTPSATAR